MQDQVKTIREQALAACRQAETVQELNEARVKFLGKKGELTLILRKTGQLPKEERPQFGKLVNEVTMSWNWSGISGKRSCPGQRRNAACWRKAWTLLCPDALWPGDGSSCQPNYC